MNTNATIDALNGEQLAGQIRRETLLLSRTGGELTLMEAALCGPAPDAKAPARKTLAALEACLAACLAESREACDSLGRTPAGHYALLLPGVSLLRARLLAEDLQKRFAAAAGDVCAAPPPPCAVGIVCADQGQRPTPPRLLRECEEALQSALTRQGHICVAGGEALDQRNTLVHSSEKRFLFFGSN